MTNYIVFQKLPFKGNLAVKVFKCRVGEQMQTRRRVVPITADVIFVVGDFRTVSSIIYPVDGGSQWGDVGSWVIYVPII